MKTLRTPDDRFQTLPSFPFQPHYTEVPDQEGGGLRVHYLDEGGSNAPVVLCMHGEPSWCFLYRKMIPVIADAGFRVIAPDLVGFGRSDKPADRQDYTYQRHVDWMQGVIDNLELDQITLVCQDWGGMIGLRLAANSPDRFARIVAANTGLPTGDRKMPDAFLAWQRFSQEVDIFDAGKIVKKGCTTTLPEDVVSAYNAPFPDESFKEGARIFPSLVPIAPNDPAAQANRQAWRVLTGFQKPFLTAFSDGDPITRGGERVFQKLVPGATGQHHTIIQGAGHFLQEDRGVELAEVVVGFID